MAKQRRDHYDRFKPLTDTVGAEFSSLRKSLQNLTTREHEYDFNTGKFEKTRVIGQWDYFAGNAQRQSDIEDRAQLGERKIPHGGNGTGSSGWPFKS